MASGQFKYQGLHDDSEIPDTTKTKNPDSDPVIPTAPVTPTAAPNATNNSDPAYPPNTTNATAVTPDNPVSASTAPMYPVNTTNDPPPLHPAPLSTDANINQASQQQTTPCQAQEYSTPYLPKFPTGAPQYPGPSTGSNTNQAFQHSTPYAYSPQGPSAPSEYVVNNQQQQGPRAPGVITIARQQGPSPQNYMGLAIFSTLCCLILGIVAIMKSSEVNTLWAQGKYEEAREAAKSARALGFIAVVVGIIGTIVVVVLRVFVIVETIPPTISPY